MQKLRETPSSIEEKSPRSTRSNSVSFMNTTQDESSNEEGPCKSSDSLCLSPAKLFADSDEESNQTGDESEDLNVSLSSLGLDFVV